MKLKASSLAKDMLAAAKGPLQDDWPQIRDYASAEFRKLALSIVMIERLYLQEKLTKTEAKLHLRIQKNASQTVLLTVQGLGLLTVERSINAALKVVRDSVNSALGFALL